MKHQRDVYPHAIHFLLPLKDLHLPRVASCYGIWGYTAQRFGSAEGGIALLSQALQIEEQYYGPDHTKVAKTLNNLGNCHGSLGDHQTERQMLERALRIMEQYYGPDHIEVAKTLSNLGSCYGSLGDHQTAKQMLERALQIMEKYYGPDHFEVAGSLNNLGNCYGSLGDHQTKKQILERALRINEQHYGSDHIEVAKTLNNLGNCHGSLGDHQTKKNMLEKALQASDSVDPQLSTKVCSNLALALQLFEHSKQAQILSDPQPALTATSSSTKYHEFDGGLFVGMFQDRLPLLLEKYKSTNKNQALRRAASLGQLNDVKTLVLECGADINAQDDNPSSRRTALHLAYMNSQQLVIEWLIAHGADEQIKDANGFIPSQCPSSSSSQ